MEPIVGTTAGKVRGTLADGMAVFRGIPFAAAPEGPLRFQLPVPAAPWDGVRDALEFGPVPPQLPAAPGAQQLWQASDGLDCLSLNVWTPDLGAAGLPVMVWIFGGAWKLGAGSLPGYDGTLLAQTGTVIVTINYRVGFEGFGLVPDAPSNRGLHDQIAALRWVRDNIAGFGGDPAAVTVFGESAGAGSIAALMGTPERLFRRAIAQSVPGDFRAVEAATEVTRIIAGAVGVEPTLAALAAVPPEALLAQQDAPLHGPSGPGITAFGPVIDGDLVRGQAHESVGGAADVDLVCGFTHEEFRLFAPGGAPAGVDLAEVAVAIGLPASAADAYRAAYPDEDQFIAMLSDALFRMPSTWTADAHAAAGGRTWLYDLTWGPRPLGACHTLDVPLTFGRADSPAAARLLGLRPQPGFAELSAAVRTAWTRFAATGDPGWDRYEPGGTTRIWDVPPTVAPYPIPASREIWSTR